MVAVLFFAIAGLLELRVTPDNRVFYGDKDPRFQELTEFEQTFRSNTKIGFVVSCKESIQDCPDLVQAINDLSARAEAIPGAQRVDSLATLPLILPISQTELSSRSYLSTVCPEANCDTRLINELQKPFLVGRFISPDQRSAAVIVSLAFDVGSTDDVERIYDASIEIADEVANDSVTVTFVGTVPMMNAFVDATNEELVGTLGLSICVIVALLFLVLGNIRLCGIALALVAASNIITLGFAGWSGLILNTATATIPLVVTTLVLATSMHLFMGILRSVSSGTQTGAIDATSASLSSQWQPILLTTATTMVCMASLVTVSSPPVQEIGIWGAIGLATGTVLLLSVVPLCTRRLDLHSAGHWPRLIQRFLNAYARRLERGRGAVIVFSILTVIASASILRLEIDDDFVRYFSPSNAFRLDTESVARAGFGANNIEVAISSGVEGGVYDPAYVDFVESMANFARADTRVANVYSLADVLHEAAVLFDLELPSTTLNEEQIAQLVLSYEMSLDYGQSVFDLVDVPRSSSRVSIVAKDIPASQIRALEREIRSFANRTGGSYETRITGESIPISHLSPRNISAVGVSIAGTFLLTAVLLAVLFRNPKLALVVVVSTVVPVVCGFGLWGVFHPTVGLSTTVIIAVCIGVVVDDSIHLIYRFFDGQRQLNLEPREAAAYSVHRVGLAIVTTTLVLTIGFAMLVTSDFTLNSTFGGCSAAIIAVALVFDLLMLPEMLVWSSEASVPQPT